MSYRSVRCRRLVLVSSYGLALIGCLSIAATSAGAATTGFLSKPTDQIAVPGTAAGGEVTPEGDLYTGWAEYELRFGAKLASWNQPTRVLPDPSLPRLASTQADGTVRYTQTLFADPVAGRPVAYESITIHNASTRRQHGRLAMSVAYTRGHQIAGAHGLVTSEFRFERPVTNQPEGLYYQPGQAYSPGFTYESGGRDLVRSGLLLARGPAAPGRSLSGSAVDTPTALHGGREYRVPLAPHAHVTLTWQIPLEPPPATPSADTQLDAIPASQALRMLRTTWGAEERGMMRISVPEPKIVATYDAAITEMLASRYLSSSGWVQGSNKLQYQAVWLRDAALETQALDLAGLHKQAEQNLAFLDRFQQPGGLFMSRRGQYDGLGQSLWALDQHAELTQSQDYAAQQLGRIGAAVEWLSAASAQDSLGLLPPSNPGDDELAYGHITGDNIWAAVGLRSAIADAKLAGRADLAARWSAIDQRFEASLNRALTTSVARSGHIAPVLDSGAGQDWGNYSIAYPVQILPSASPPVRAMLAWARRHMVQGLATYSHGQSLHDYLGFSIFETELAAGETARAVAGLYAELTHTTSTDNGWEWGISPLGSRSSPVDMAPHGTFAADYVALLRNMLVASGQPQHVTLLAGPSPAWLAPGQHIAVTDAPTPDGLVSFVEQSTAHGETLRWRTNLASSTVLSWTLPRWARHARTASGAAIRSPLLLRGSSGSLSLTFSGQRPRESYAASVIVLNQYFATHHRAKPLVPARD